MPTNEIKYISSPEDLMAIWTTDSSARNHYELTCDIDMTGYEWNPGYSYFSGVIDGKGFSIKNISHIAVHGENDNLYGLINSNLGVIQNLHIDNMVAVVKVNSDFCIGGFVANNQGYVINCSIDAGSMLLAFAENTQKKYNILVGGIVADNIAGKIEGCTSEAILTSAFGGVGGICGRNLDGCSVINCINDANLNNSVSSGICHDNAGLISGCVNNGVMSGISEASGIVRFNSGRVEQCINNADLDAIDIAGGICGANYGGAAVNCENNGRVDARICGDIFAEG